VGRQRDLSTEVIERLKHRIIHWEYPPGHRFVEQELSNEFRISRSPVREALQILSANGFVEQTPGRGYRVYQLGSDEVYELYEVRLALELFTLEKHAARGISRDRLAKMRHPWKSAALGSSKTAEQLALMDRAFHETLAELTGNRALMRHLREINDRLHLFRVIDFGGPERVRTTCAQHLEILDRLESGDLEAAKQAMRENIAEGRKNVENNIKDALARSFFRTQNTTRP
jgi:DNA-binding GntR family transcriptional regulator